MELNIFFSFQGTTAPRGPGLLYYRGYAITLSDTPQSIGHPWTSDRTDVEASA